MNINYNILNDYKIKSSNEIIGNKEVIKSIQKWISSSEYRNNIIGLYVYGQTGIGKTLLIKLLLKEYNYTVYNYTPSNIPNKKDIYKSLKNYIYSDDIISHFLKKKNNKKAIVIDEIETLLNSHKTIIQDLLKMININKKNENKKLNNIIIIFIGDLSHSKYTSIIKKHCISYELLQIKNKEIKDHINKICSKVNIYIEDPAIDYIIDYSKHDLRQLLYILNNVFNICQNNNINLDTIISILNNVNQRKSESTLFETTKYFLDHYSNLDKQIEYYNYDKYLLPLMIQENYLNTVNRMKLDNTSKMKIIKNISNALIKYDTLDNFMYATQSWDLQDICGILSCSHVSYYINSVQNCMCCDKILFTNYLNKISLISINKKNIYDLWNVFNLSNTTQLYYVRNAILNILIDKKNNNKSNKIFDILKNIYHLDKRKILILSKIDKIDNNRKYDGIII